MVIYLAGSLGLGFTVKYCCEKYNGMEWSGMACPKHADRGVDAIHAMSCCTECQVMSPTAVSLAPEWGALAFTSHAADLVVTSRYHDRYAVAHSCAFPAYAADPSGHWPPLFIMNSVFRI